MAIFNGSGVAIVTPMNEDLSVNYNKLEELVEFHIANSTDAIVIAGTTGESATLTMEEHREVVKRCIQMVNHRVPVVAGASSNSTATAIKHVSDAQEDGADGVLIVTPYYNKATQHGLITHYTKIAENTKLPIILYNVPSRTGCNLEPATVATLFKNVPNIVGLKDATGNMSQASKTMNLCDGKLELYSGEDGLIVPLMSIGGVGVISVLANVAPAETHDICAAAARGDYETARALQFRALPLIDALFSEVNPIPVKMALNLMGMEVGSLRGPLEDMQPEAAKKLKEEMVKYGLIA